MNHFAVQQNKYNIVSQLYIKKINIFKKNQIVSD